MSDADLARQCGLSRTTIKYWKDGTTKHPRPEHLFPAARVLGVEAEWLGTGSGIKAAVTQQAAEQMSAYVVQHLPDKTRDLLRWMETMPPHVVEAIYLFVKTLNDGVRND